MNAKASTPAEKDTWKWWYYILGGLAVVGMAAFEYYDLTDFEATGGTRRMHSALVLAYNLLGKWGVVGTLGVLAALLFAIGLYSLFDGKDATSEPPPM